MKMVLDKIYEKCQLLAKEADENIYKVPGIWFGEPGEIEFRNAYEFFTFAIERVKKSKADMKPYDEHTSVIYNVFVRLATAYDHDGDAELAVPYGKHGFRETGTFLKSIALLTYIKDLGVDVVYLLPVSLIGRDRKKGNLGSPYAISNPLRKDDMLAEPIEGFSVEDQYEAFVIAAHLVGLKVVQEFVFRTASVDSIMALEHPEWFYWIKDNILDRTAASKNTKKYGPPVFNENLIEEIKNKINNSDFNDLPGPDLKFKTMFTETPENVVVIGDRITGYLKDGTKCRIPGAFCDWPPDDTQPVWSDVTYLKLYDGLGFNYIAYNTVRMYDEALAKTENEVRPLWDFIINIIPHYIKNHGVDGVMIDMGHSLPFKLREAIIREARALKPDFIFWEENFVLTKKSRLEGYNAALGYMPFDEHKPERLRDLIKIIEQKQYPIPFFATAETHNTPRATMRPGGADYSRMAMTLNYLLPVPAFVHNGCELAEITPVNTGLDFREEELHSYPAGILPLFSTAKLNWMSFNGFIPLIKTLASLRKKILPADLILLNTNNEKLVSFLARNAQDRKEYIYAGNFSDKSILAEVEIGEGAVNILNYFDGTNIPVEAGKIKYRFAPWNCFIGEITLEDILINNNQNE